MTDQQQRNADIAKSVERALNQKDIDCREWKRQSKQWEARWQAVTTERDGERAKIGNEWIRILNWLIEDTQERLDDRAQTQVAFYNGKLSALTYLRSLAQEDAAETRLAPFAAILAAAEHVLAPCDGSQYTLVPRAALVALRKAMGGGG